MHSAFIISMEGNQTFVTNVKVGYYGNTAALSVLNRRRFVQSTSRQLRLALMIVPHLLCTFFRFEIIVIYSLSFLHGVKAPDIDVKSTCSCLTIILYMSDQVVGKNNENKKDRMVLSLS